MLYGASVATGPTGGGFVEGPWVRDHGFVSAWAMELVHEKDVVA